MKAKKTAKIEDMIELVNERNKNSTCQPLVRQGQNDLLEMILHKNGRYNGFRYYTKSEVPDKHPPGIKRVDNENTFPDDTRRFYYMR